MKVLKSRKGEGYIDVVITVLVSMMMIVLAVNTFQFLSIKQTMDYMSDELLHTATQDGKVGSNTTDKRRELEEETGLTLTSCTWDTGGKSQVQLGDKITLTLTYKTKFAGLGTIAEIPMTLTTKQSGLSEHYWK